MSPPGGGSDEVPAPRGGSAGRPKVSPTDPPPGRAPCGSKITWPGLEVSSPERFGRILNRTGRLGHLNHRIEPVDFLGEMIGVLP